MASKGEKWLKLLRAYSPVADNEAMQGEHVDNLAAYLDIPKLAFTHPARQLLIDCFPASTGTFRNVVLTGTAGEGKTSLCFELVQELTGNPSAGEDGVQVISVPTPLGPRTITLIYDVTAWRKKTPVGILCEEHVEMFSRIARSAFGESDEFFVLAINDGQMHELFRALPPETPEIVLRLKQELIGLHARGKSDSGDYLRLINLSTISSEEIMKLCLDAVLERPEWICFSEEPDKAIFREHSSLSRNYRALKTPAVREKLIMLARVADVTGRHLPTRGILCLLANALLGHPDAEDGVIRNGVEAETISNAGTAYKAAIHRTLFGENLSPSNRDTREIYRFLSILHVGDETTNDLDELLIFGTRDEELRAGYEELVAPDPFSQRNPDFEALLQRYIRGEINSEKETDEFLTELAAERRRIFIHATLAQLEKHSLWRVTVFHHAQEFISDILDPLHQGKSPARLQVRKIASGLNRIWTGLLLADVANDVLLATGLDLTTSPISDIHLAQLYLDSEPPGLRIVLEPGACVPDAVLTSNDKQFKFALTLSRFEFLCRVSNGAMPSSFSRESCSDFMSLKQRCLRELDLKASPKSLHLIEVIGAGIVQRHPIHLEDQ